VTQFLPRPNIRRFSDFPSNADTQTSWPSKQTNLEIFLFYSNTDSKSHPPHPSYTLIPLSTHISRSPSVLRLTTTSQFALTRTQCPPTTTELYVNLEQEESLPNESHWDLRIIPPHKHFLDFWIFGFFLKGWGSHTPRAGGRLPPHSFDYTLAWTGRISISSLSHWSQRRKPRGARDCR